MTASETAVLFVHGIYGSYRHFSFLYPLLPENLSYVALELAGHEGDVQEFSKARMADWEGEVEEAVDLLLSKGKKIKLVGHSMGCLFAIREAEKHPEVESLFLLNPPLYWHFKASNVKPYWELMQGQAEKSEMAKQMRDASDLTLTKNPFAYLGMLPSLAELDHLIKTTRRHLASCRAPAVCFLAPKDELVGSKTKALCLSHPGFRVVEIPSSGHFAYGEKDQALIQQEFLTYIKD